jgi:diacylglycerol kinase family enzyme
MAAPHASNAAALKVFLNSAGGGAQAAREALAKAGLDLQVVQPNELESRLKQEVDSGAKRILVAGGDGTIATAASLVANKDIELAIFPCGTLNHFAKDHEVPTDMDKAVGVALNGVVVGADIGYIGDSIFLNTSSLGAYVSFVRVRERFERHLGYRIASFLAFVRTWVHLRSFTVTLEVGGEKKEFRSSMVFIGVGERELKLPILGNRVKNGRRGLHVMIVGGRKRARLFALALAGIAKGTKEAEKLPEFDDFLVDSCRIDLTRSHALIGLDGELKEVRAPLDYKFERDALRLVVSPPEVDE